jgi:hypothetical protein
MASSSAMRFFFSLGLRRFLRFPQLDRTDLLADGHQFSYQMAKAAIFGKLSLGTFEPSALGNHLRDRFSSGAMSQGMRGAMPGGTLLGTVAIRLPTSPEAGRQKSWTQIIDLSEASRELNTFFA